MPDRPEDMVPPWEEFPTYERHTIGWRMGLGEDYLYDWHAFVKQLPSDYEARLSYLRGHRPAPLNWGDTVLHVLDPAAESDQEYGCSPSETLKLLNLGLVEHDVAYHTWLSKQADILWPWSLPVGDTPEEAARYCTREFWFFSRQIEAARSRGDLESVQVPAAWHAVEAQLRSGHVGDLDSAQGLLTLARMLCAGQVRPPWTLGLSPHDFADSFEMDMGYADAFRLWIMSAFDDDMLLRKLLQESGVPSDWAPWVDEQADFG